jgi:hypothetical protein
MTKTNYARLTLVLAIVAALLAFGAGAKARIGSKE